MSLHNIPQLKEIKQKRLQQYIEELQQQTGYIDQSSHETSFNPILIKENDIQIIPIRKQFSLQLEKQKQDTEKQQSILQQISIKAKILQQKPTCLTVLFPKATFRSVTTLIVFINILVMISLKIYQSQLNLKYVCVLYDFQSTYGPDIRFRGEIQKLILPLFYHSGYINLLFSQYALLTYGFVLEQYYGKAAFFFNYAITGIAGNMVNSLSTSYLLSVGAINSLFGIFGLYIVFFLENRNQYGSKISLFFWMFIAIMSIQFVAIIESTSFNLYGIICSLLFAVLFGFTLYKTTQNNRKIKCLKIGIYSSLFATFIGLLIVCLTTDILDLNFFQINTCSNQ